MDSPAASPFAVWKRDTFFPLLARRYGAFCFLVAFASYYYLSNAQVMLDHYDLGWHLAAGDLIRKTGAVPYQDFWSFTLQDKRWFNLSWLWDVIASVIYQFAGFSGLALATVACGALIVVLLTVACFASGATALGAVAAVLPACLLYPTFATEPNIYLSVSPNNATMLGCALVFAACIRRRGLLLLPVVMLFWANLHGGFVLGFLMLGVFFAEAALKRDMVWARRLGFVIAACAAATFVNPLGWRVYEGIAATLGHFVQAEITEWQSYWSNVTMPGSLPGMIYMAIFVGLELRGGVPRAIPSAPRVLAWMFLALGFYQFRYMAFFFMFSAVPLSLHVEALLRDRVEAAKLQQALLAAGLMGACMLPLTYLKVSPGLGLVEMLSPEDAGYLKAHHRTSRLLNHWNVGGVLIFLTQGQVPVFVDGRAATAYPDDLLRDYLKLVTPTFQEAAWETALAKYNIDTVLWVKAHDALRQYLVGKKGWKEEYSGRYETVYVKP